MATAAVVSEPDEKECSMCHEQFTDPKLLPCGHLLCRRPCLLSWLKSQKAARCPLCRCPIVDAELKRGEKSPEDIADGFPTDLSMKMLVDAERVLSQGPSSCCVCEDVAAASVCLTCGDMLCESCTKAHRKMSVTKHHVVEELSSLTAEELAAATHRPEPCAVHADKTSEVFCPTHGLSVCLLCATTDHRRCPEVTTLETQMEEARASLADMAATLGAGEAALERAVAQLDRHLQETEERTRAAIAEIEETCDRLESAVKACRRRLKELALSACADVRDAVQDGKARLRSRRGKLTSHERVVERVRQMKARAALKDMTLTLKTRVAGLDCSAALPSGAKTVSSVTWIIDPKAVSRVEQALSELGQVKIVPAGIAHELGQVKIVPAGIAQAATFSFHGNHGGDIVLSNNRKTAEKHHPLEGGIVIASQPMEINKLYEIQLDRKVDSFTSFMTCPVLPLGVVTSSPEGLVLPTSAYHWTSAIVIGEHHVSVHGCETPSTLGKAIRYMPQGSRLGLCLDTKRNLLLYFNGMCLGTAAKSVAEPAHCCFDICRPYLKITALPVTTLK